MAPVKIDGTRGSPGTCTSSRFAEQGRPPGPPLLESPSQRTAPSAGRRAGAPAGDGTLVPRPTTAPPAATPPAAPPAGSAGATTSAVPGPPDRPPTAAEVARAVSWAEAAAEEVFEVEPLRCPRCGGSLAVVAWITEADTIDRLLAHRRRRGIESPSREPRPGRPPRRDVAPRGVPCTRRSRQETVSPRRGRGGGAPCPGPEACRGTPSGARMTVVGATVRHGRHN